MTLTFLLGWLGVGGWAIVDRTFRGDIPALRRMRRMRRMTVRRTSRALGTLALLAMAYAGTTSAGAALAVPFVCVVLMTVLTIALPFAALRPRLYAATVAAAPLLILAAIAATAFRR